MESPGNVSRAWGHCVGLRPVFLLQPSLEMSLCSHLAGTALLGECLSPPCPFVCVGAQAAPTNLLTV